MVNIYLDGGRNAFVAPDTKITALPFERLNAIIKKLGIAEDKIVGSAYLENGPVWIAIELDNVKTVLNVDSTLIKYDDFGQIGFFAVNKAQPEINYNVRMLAPSSGMAEDPITGSLNAALAKWLFSQGRLNDSLIKAQGQKIGWEGRVYVNLLNRDEGHITICGETQILIEGRVLI